jgi:long-subunit acyl-CoA synthetase (AMP-forming)
MHSYSRWMQQVTSDIAPPSEITPDSHLVLIYTSGTTGSNYFGIVPYYVILACRCSCDDSFWFSNSQSFFVGLTGNPKGVTLSHANIVHVLRGIQTLWRDEIQSHRSLAFLPWAHVYGQVSELQIMVSSGSCLGIVSSRFEMLIV